MTTVPVFLLVEPSPVLCSSLHEWLESVLTDPRIFFAANGLDALWLAAQEQPSHILIEMYLPDIIGFEVVRQMRQGLPAARIIATGSHESRFFLKMVRSAGADEFILKNKLRNELLSLWEIPPGYSTGPESRRK
jgi:CheY-like chemotaxis protein